MADFGRDLFTGTNWAVVSGRSPDMGGPWVQHPSNPGQYYIVDNRAVCRTAGTYYISGTPDSANYRVEADIVVQTAIGQTGIAGRIATGAYTMYYAYINTNNTELVLAKWVNGSVTSLGVWFSTFSTGTTYRLALDMQGTTIRALVNGTERISVTDSSITAAGKAGMRCPSVSDRYTGKVIDNFLAFDGSTPPPPSGGGGGVSVASVVYVPGIIG